MQGVADRDTLARWTHLVHTSVERIARPSVVEPRLHRLWSAVLASPEQPWTIDTLARQVGVSDEHLRRLCQKEVGCSPMEHVTHLRVQHAFSLLMTGRYSVTAVSERVGYGNPFAFSAAFKRVIAPPPGTPAGCEPSCISWPNDAYTSPHRRSRSDRVVRATPTRIRAT